MILVTGATGFLGKRVCNKLDKMGIEYSRTSLSLGVDLRSEKEAKALFAEIKPDYVLNCAAFLGGVQFGYEHAAEMFDNNIKIEINLLNACKDTSVKRLINPIGNCSYPGELDLYKESEFWNGKLHESVQAYGLAKKAFCIGAWAYNKQYQLETINLVLPNMYGPEDHFDEQRSHAVGALIGKFVLASHNAYPKVIVWGTGKPIREWLHVDDAATAMIKAKDIPYYNDIINIGVGKGISIYDTAMMLKEITDYKGTIEFDSSKLDGALCKTMDGQLGQELLGWKPEIDFKEGLASTVEWYVRHILGK